VDALMRGLVLAVQFLTRLPVPALASFDERELSRSAAWFPVVGLLVGACVALAMILGLQIEQLHKELAGGWLPALFGLIAWLWVTGGLHADGVADLADALGASHRDPARLQAVLKDPHIGSFGVMALLLLLLAKLVLLMLWVKASLPLAPLLLTAAWGRWSAMVWAVALPPLTAGHGERFAWSLKPAVIGWSGLLLTLLSLWWMPALVAGLLAAGLWYLFLRRKLGGMCGDALGAGIEVVEVLLLLAGVALAAS